MPGYRTHLVGGICAFACGWYVVVTASGSCPAFTMAIEWLCCALLGSLFPDIDTKSKGQKVFYLGILSTSVTLLISGQLRVVAGLCCLAFIPLIVRHRGLFHRTWFVILLPLVCAFAASFDCSFDRGMLMTDALFFIAGALSHLILDLGLRKTFGLR
jgi:hypothetical protein